MSPVQTVTVPPRAVMFARAIRKHCPVCGGGGLFDGWFRMKPACPTCGVRFNRGESGYSLGAMWFNLMAAEAVTVTSFITTVLLTWPSPPWDLLQYTGPLEALLMPLIFYPFSRTLFLAFDLCFRPVNLDQKAVSGTR